MERGGARVPTWAVGRCGRRGRALRSDWEGAGRRGCLRRQARHGATTGTRQGTPQRAAGAEERARGAPSRGSPAGRHQAARPPRRRTVCVAAGRGRAADAPAGRHYWVGGQGGDTRRVGERGDDASHTPSRLLCLVFKLGRVGPLRRGRQLRHGRHAAGRAAVSCPRKPPSAPLLPCATLPPPRRRRPSATGRGAPHQEPTAPHFKPDNDTQRPSNGPTAYGRRWEGAAAVTTQMGGGGGVSEPPPPVQPRTGSARGKRAPTGEGGNPRTARRQRRAEGEQQRAAPAAAAEGRHPGLAARGCRLWRRQRLWRR